MAEGYDFAHAVGGVLELLAEFGKEELAVVDLVLYLLFSFATLSFLKINNNISPSSKNQLQYQTGHFFVEFLEDVELLAAFKESDLERVDALVMCF